MSSTGGWYPDPHDPGRVRWWDGRWTDHVQDDPRLTPAPEERVATPAAAPMPTAAEPARGAAAPSIGAALLPPLPTASAGVGVAPPPPAFPSEPAPSALLDPSSRRSGPSLRLLVLAVGLVAVALALVLVVGGVVRLGTSGGQDASSEVYEGPAYAVDLPRAWDQIEAPDSANVDASYRTSHSGVFTIGSAQGDAAALADPAAHSDAVDVIVRVQLAVYPQVQVAARESMTLDGAPAERVTLDGVTPQGQPIRVTQVIAVHDGLLVFLGIEGTPEAVTADATSLEHVISSFEFA